MPFGFSLFKIQPLPSPNSTCHMSLIWDKNPSWGTHRKSTRKGRLKWDQGLNPDCARRKKSQVLQNHKTVCNVAAHQTRHQHRVFSKWLAASHMYTSEAPASHPLIIPCPWTGAKGHILHGTWRSPALPFSTRPPVTFGQGRTSAPRIRN